MITLDIYNNTPNRALSEFSCLETDIPNLPTNNGVNKPNKRILNGSIANIIDSSKKMIFDEENDIWVEFFDSSSSTGGGGGASGAVDSVNGQTGTVTITAESLNAVDRIENTVSQINFNSGHHNVGSIQIITASEIDEIIDSLK